MVKEPVANFIQEAQALTHSLASFARYLSIENPPKDLTLRFKASKLKEIQVQLEKMYQIVAELNK